MGDIVQCVPKRPYGGEIVTRDRSYEWGNIWGYLPDPDPILLKLKNILEYPISIKIAQFLDKMRK